MDCKKENAKIYYISFIKIDEFPCNIAYEEFYD